MENKFEMNKNLKSNEKLEFKFDREVAADVVIPDYCDDINRIIRVDAKPIVKNKYQSGGSVKINGVLAVTVLYVSEPMKQLKSISFTNEFDYDLHTDESGEDCDLSVNVVVTELNCRLLNPRKLSARIQTFIMICLYPRCSEEEFYHENDYAGGEIEKLDEYSRHMLARVGEGEIKIEENLTVQDESAVGEIIYADVNITVDDIKPIYNKAVVKFTADIKCLYNTAGEKIEYKTITKKSLSTIIVDLNDADEKFECVAKMWLSSLKTDVDVDSYGENKIINVEFMVQAEVKAFKNVEKPVIVDAYSPKYENVSQNSSIMISKFKSVIKEKFEMEDSVALEDAGINSVIDTAGIVMVNEIAINNSTLTVSSNAEISVIAVTAEGEMQNLDCTIPLKNDINLQEALTGGNCEIQANICEMSAFIDSNKLTVRISVAYECVISQQEEVRFIKTLVVDDEKMKSVKKDIQMVLYYPAKNENLWNIAKKYNTSMVKLAKYNKCENNNIGDKKIIVIPV